MTVLVKSKMLLVSGSLAAALGASMLAPPVAAQERIAPPPTGQELVVASNAMLQPEQVTGALLAETPRSDRTLRVGFNNPPGGQDPLPICVSAPGYTTVSIPLTRATGFDASYGRVSQVVYQYPSTAAANRAWRKVSRDISTKCRGSFTERGTRTSITSQRIPGLPQGERGWGVRSAGNFNVYSAVHLVGDAIQMLSYVGEDKVVAPRVRPAINRLAGELAGRWVTRSELATTQNPAVTRAESSMLQQSDVPTGLTVATPAQGGWSSFFSYLPGNDFDLFCQRRTTFDPAAQSFGSVIGGTGDVFGFVGRGNIYQQLQVFASAAEAQQVWQRLNGAVRGCSQNPTGSVPKNEDFSRFTNGSTPDPINGTPAVWTRQLQTYVSENLSVNTYTVYALAENAIQILTYSVTNRGLRQVPINQPAVNGLAQQLADRWVQAGR